MSEDQESKGKVDPVDCHVGKRLKMRRIMLGLSQHDLGDAVNVSIQQIQKYEKATNRISSGRLYAFAKLLMVPVEFFFSEVENMYDFKEQTSLNDEKESFEHNSPIPEKELINLVRSYSEIKDPSVRKRVVDLLKAMSVEQMA